MPPPKSIGNFELGIEKDEECHYEYFPNVEKPGISQVSHSQPKCGFNADDKYYCRVQEGDYIVSDFLNVLSYAFGSNLQCHSYYQMSDKFEGIENCRDFQNANKKVSAHALRQARLHLNGDINSLVVNNPKCVKSTITKYFWKRRKYVSF